MSYVFVSAIARKHGNGHKWESIDPRPIAIDVLHATYQSILIKLSNVFLADPIIFNMVTHRGNMPISGLTFGTWLINNGSNVLPSDGKDYTVTYKQCRATDVAKLDYNYRVVHPTLHPDGTYPDPELTDLMLTKTGQDYDYLAKHCLISINGMYHLTNGSVYGLYVRNGRVSKDRANDNVVGIISFANIGQVTMVPLTEDMIYKTNDDQELSKVAYIDLGINTDNKSVIFCIGGYLHIVDGSYVNVGSGLFRLDTANIQIAARIFESRKLIDLSPLDSFMISGNPDLIPIAAIQSDDFMKAYLTLSQSFAVIVDTDSLVVTRTPLPESDLPGVYVSFTEPLSPLFARGGRGLTYWSRKQDGQWALGCQLVYDTVAQFQTTGWTEIPYITSATDINRKVYPSPATFVAIGHENVTITT